MAILLGVVRAHPPLSNFSLCVGEMRVFGHVNVGSAFTAFKNLKENSLHATQDFY
jgi:hypothetical protein